MGNNDENTTIHQSTPPCGSIGVTGPASHARFAVDHWDFQLLLCLARRGRTRGVGTIMLVYWRYWALPTAPPNHSVYDTSSPTNFHCGARHRWAVFTTGAVCFRGKDINMSSNNDNQAQMGVPDTNSESIVVSYHTTKHHSQSWLIDLHSRTFGCIDLLWYRRAMIMSLEEIVSRHGGTTISMRMLDCSLLTQLIVTSTGPSMNRSRISSDLERCEK